MPLRTLRNINRRVFLDPEYGGVNMSVAQLEAWIDNPNHRLASTATGLNSLSRLPDFVQKPESRWTRADYAFAKKVLNFNRRHAQQVINAFREDRTGGFGREVGKSGWSKRHIALRNWGHDPSDPDSPLYAADQEWLDEHPGAESRRNPRMTNPSPRYLYVAGNPIPNTQALLAGADLTLFGEAVKRGEFLGLLGMSGNPDIGTMVRAPLTLKIPVKSLVKANPGMSPLLCEINYSVDAFLSDNMLGYRRVVNSSLSVEPTSQITYLFDLATKGIGTEFVSMCWNVARIFLKSGSIGKSSSVKRAVTEAAEMEFYGGDFLIDGTLSLADLMYDFMFYGDGNEVIGLKQAIDEGYIELKTEYPSITPELIRDGLENLLREEVEGFKSEQEWVAQTNDIKLPAATSFIINPRYVTLSTSSSGRPPEAWRVAALVEFVESLKWPSKSKAKRITLVGPPPESWT